MLPRRPSCFPALFYRLVVTPDLNQLSAWQYHLPDHLIAGRPTARRDESRLMVVDRHCGEIRHGSFRDLPDLLRSGDRLVFNNTKVVPARLFGFRTSTRGRWEGLFLSVESDGRWLITGKTRGRLQPGETLSVYPAGSDPDRVTVDECLTLRLDEKTEQGTWIVSPEDERDPYAVLEQFGTLPLPPYIGRPVADEEDRQRYQTVFAETPGAIAAPTAGLHFTDQVLNACEQREVTSSKVTLHVGIGTFRPVNSECLSDHEMHSEWCEVTAETAAEIRQTRQDGGRVFAVGTTSVRTLESAARSGEIGAHSGDTDLFIQPGFPFRAVDGLLTNFHLPGSTLIVLVAALAGYDLTMKAYAEAVKSEYRFYSYGDAMLIL